MPELANELFEYDVTHTFSIKAFIPIHAQRDQCLCTTFTSPDQL
jgi:hypothetical protein